MKLWLLLCGTMVSIVVCASQQAGSSFKVTNVSQASVAISQEKQVTALIQRNILLESQIKEHQVMLHRLSESQRQLVESNKQLVTNFNQFSYNVDKKSELRPRFTKCTFIKYGTIIIVSFLWGIVSKDCGCLESKPS